jgi:hypothetical protein
MTSTIAISMSVKPGDAVRALDGMVIMSGANSASLFLQMCDYSDYQLFLRIAAVFHPMYLPMRDIE